MKKGRESTEMEKDESPSVTADTGSTLPLESPVTHNLPKIPSMRSSLGKVTVKEKPQSEAEKYPNLVSQEELENKKQEDDDKTTSVSSTPSNAKKMPSSLPTPPSDSALSEHTSPKPEAPAPEEREEADKPPSPIKMRIRRSMTEGGLRSSVESNEGDIKVGEDKNKDAKKQSKKKSKETSEPQAADSTQGVETAVPVKPKKTAIDPLDAQYPAQWLVGDMLWAKVSGHPWWPCMVSYDPYDSLYTKILSGVRMFRQYHVQFFGNEGERGWIRDNCLVDFEGTEKFETYRKDMYIKFKSKKERKRFEAPTASKKPAWDIAAAHAEEAYALDRNERKQQYTFTYVLPDKKKDAEKEKSVESASDKAKKRKLSIGTPNSKSPPRKKRRRKSQSPSKNPDLMANQSMVRFMVFCLKRRESVRRDHPSYTEAQQEKVLKEQWAKLPDEQKSKFIPMGSDVQHLSTLLPSPKSKKKSDSSEPESKRRRSTTRKSLDVNPSVALTADIDIDAIVNSVAAGAGNIPELPPAPVPKPKSETKKSKKGVTASDTDDNHSVASSSTQSRRASSIVKPENCIGEYELEIFKLNASCANKKENVCLLCEEPGEMILCEGACGGSYHFDCLGLSKKPVGTFKCDECLTGNHTCFVCKRSGPDTKKCSTPFCGRFYHAECTKRYPWFRTENGHIYCPLHTCSTCAAADNATKSASKGRFLKCIRCPTAYHASELCLAAGSMQLAGSNIVCSRHFKPVKSHSHHTHINVPYCFICAKGGTLICCETCPLSFHTGCLNISQPEGAWHCRDCTNGLRPLYGDIVWVKVGSYRWWPGEVCHPKNVPANIQNKEHQVGEFPIRFFGSHDYFWTHQGRVFVFQEGDRGGKVASAASKGLMKIFEKAVNEATDAFKIWSKEKQKKESQQQEKNDRKPAPYKHIKNNVPVGNAQVYRADPQELPRCECKDNAACGPDSECINRLMQYECHPSTCPSRDKCQNQRFQRREYPDTVTFKTEKSGWGLRALVDIKKGDFVNEYVGELLDEEECKRRIKKAHDDNITNFYMLTLDKNRIIDAGPRGNWSRFMNHSCQPNCETQKWTVNGDIRIGLFAVEDIEKGAPLTFNYNLEALGNEKTACRCGAPNCSGFLGIRPKNIPEKETKKKEKKKKKKKSIVKVHDDECFRCGYGGELVLCDITSCPKVYHLKCLKLNKLPHGKWICPWHHCDECGRKSRKMCSECPNSFCGDHIQGNIFCVGSERLICSDHDDILAAVEESKLEALCNNEIKPGSEPPSSAASEISDSEVSGVSAGDSVASESSSTKAKRRQITTSVGQGKKNRKSLIAQNENVSSTSGKPDCSVDINTNADSGKIVEEPKQNGRKRRSSVLPDIKPGTPSSTTSSISSEKTPTNKKAKKTPKSNGKSSEETDGKSSEDKNKKSKRGRPSKSKSEVATPVGDTKKEEKSGNNKMFDDDSEDSDFPELVIDIP